MNVDNAVYPQAEQMAEALAQGSSGPIVMVNLVKFKDRATYADGRPDDVDGRTAYARYGEEMRGFIEARGGRLLFMGDVRSLLIGQVETLWDAVALVEYPSFDAFVQIATAPEVARFGIHREAGIAGQLLIHTVERSGF